MSDHLPSPASNFTSDYQTDPARPRFPQPEGQILRELRQALDCLIRLVSRRYEQMLTAEERQQLDRLGERVCGLMLAVGMARPALPRIIHPLMPYGPTEFPVYHPTAWAFVDKFGPGALVPSGGIGPLWEQAWQTVLIGVDAWLGTMKEIPISPTTQPRVSREELNIKAREYLRDHPSATQVKIAIAIGCSRSTVWKLPAYKTVREELRKGRKPKSPKAMSLTGGEGQVDKELKRLTDEQAADAEPSPLEEDPPDRLRRPKIRKRV